jgi:GT2 family glycosyltransferase/acetyltransferase-like isoleucine patch superfamily enzyme
MAKIGVSVVIVTYNSASDIEACLSALERSSGPVRLQTVVVDNASTDGTVELVARHPEVELVALDRNTGYAEGVNRGVQSATEDLVVLLNPDCVVDPTCVATLADHLHRHQGVGVAAANLRNVDGTPQHFARRDLTVPAVFWNFTRLGQRLDRDRFGGRAAAHRRYLDEQPPPGAEHWTVDCPAAACVMTWRSLVLPEPMDLRLPLLFNDADLYRRLRRLGYRADVVAAAGASHGYGASLATVPSLRMRAEFVASTRTYLGKWWGVRRTAAVTAIFGFDVVAALAESARRSRRRSALDHAAATAGGLGLPGVPQPWLHEQPSLRRRLGRARSVPSRATKATLRSLSRRTRRAIVVRRLRLGAWISGAALTLDVDGSCELPIDLRVEMQRRPCVLRLGPDVRIQRGVVIRLWSGELLVGAGSEVRYGSCLTVKGRLELGPRSIVSRGVNVHADGAMTWGWGVAIAEGATIIDNAHTFDATRTHVLDRPVEVHDVTIEDLAFVGAGAYVSPGVTIGRGAVIAAGSIVRDDVPAGWIAAGVPARPIRLVQPACGDEEGS